ncbi:hypothetical protein NIES4106_23040 [Fischerella sp. NIES-4106]|jgi:hypothetical protein|nr:hypothetical protein NIES4106_23040 [Fischerella sp. NIES-4106]
MFKPHQLPWLVLLRFFVPALDSVEVASMIFQLNLAAIFAVASQTDGKKAKPFVLKDVILYPVVGFL